MYKTISINKQNKIKILDQRKLPFKTCYIITDNYKTVIKAIKNLSVRGAPAIGVAGGFAAFLAINKINNNHNFKNKIKKMLKEIESSRPTAVNLSWALKKFYRILDNKKDSLPELKKIFFNISIDIEKQEIEVSNKISKNGVKLIKNNFNILTHCNTGRLATPGIGTALGIISSANKIRKNIKLFATETRPLNQGSRLTTWEANKEGINCTLITDSMAAYSIQEKEIDLVIVGADRIALNGDTANKIGTLQLAILARYYSIPFYVAAPISTFDKDSKSGLEIIIENRDQEEVFKINQIKITQSKKALNPAFDITPSKLITGIITDKGIIQEPNKNKIKKLLLT
tara:strand:- start:30313 stop:31341 length:1029 start_codon:yes stop_codon:yes gene_type:complete